MARIMVESPLTKDIIEANSHQLKFSLMEHGIKVDKFSVFVGHDQTQSDQDYDGSPSQGSRKGYDPEEGEEAPPIREEDIPVLRRATMGRGNVDFFA